MKTDKRTKLVQTAMKLAYQQGFRKTTLADIAEESRVPLGNVYYYFKTKDEIGEAIIQQRLQEMERLLETWNKAGSAKERLCASVQTTAENAQMLARGGWVIGTLCSELHKEGGALAKMATQLFIEHLSWMEEQFRALGRVDDARGLSIHLLSALQGVAVLSNTFHDSRMVELETERLKDWICAL